MYFNLIMYSVECLQKNFTIVFRSRSIYLCLSVSKNAFDIQIILFPRQKFTFCVNGTFFP